MIRNEISRIAMLEVVQTPEIKLETENIIISNHSNISQGLSLSTGIILIAASTAIGIIVLLLVNKKLQQSNYTNITGY